MTKVSDERDTCDGLPRTSRVRTLVVLLTCTLAVRGSVLMAMSGNLAGDPDGYRNVAENLLLHGVYGHPDAPRDRAPAPSAYRPPLYPLVLTKVAQQDRVTPVAVGLLHLLLGVATVWLVWLLAEWWQLGRWGILAAILVACDPILLNQSTLVMTETLATFLSVVCLLCLTRLSRAPTPWHAGLAGSALALAMLCRPTFMVWLIAAAIAAPLLRCSLSRRLANAGTLLLAAAIVLSPWAIRNYRQFRKPIVTTTHGGYTLWLGNNWTFYKFLRSDHSGHSIEFLLQIQFLGQLWSHPKQQNLFEIDETLDDRIAYEMAFGAIHDQPGMFAYACAYRIGQLWNPLPHQLRANESLSRCLLRYATAVWYVTVFVLAVLGINSLRWQVLRTPWLWGVLLCLSFTAVHTVYWTNLRMRAPLMPVVCLLAAAGAAQVAARVRRRK
jgi:4-amino-4-deoxy-L-arabinose transferase-like glycosyltransferase